jgi:hypothetical protein
MTLFVRMVRTGGFNMPKTRDAILRKQREGKKEFQDLKAVLESTIKELKAEKVVEEKKSGN